MPCAVILEGSFFLGNGKIYKRACVCVCNGMLSNKAELFCMRSVT